MEETEDVNAKVQRIINEINNECCRRPQLICLYIFHYVLVKRCPCKICLIKNMCTEECPDFYALFPFYEKLDKRRRWKEKRRKEKEEKKLEQRRIIIT